MKIEESEVINVPDAAKLLGCSRTKIYEMANRHQLPHRRIGRKIIFSRVALTAWLRGEPGK